LWQQFGLSELLQRLCGDREISDDYARIVQWLLINQRKLQQHFKLERVV
jgi:hypothetical protein